MDINNDIIDLVGVLPYLAGALILLVLYKLITDWLTPYDDQAEMERGNLAASLSRGGAYVGVMVAMTGSLIGLSDGYWADLGSFMVDGLFAVAAFIVASKLFDYVILYRVRNHDAIEEGNVAVGLVEASSYISLGMIMCAAFGGEGFANFWTGMGSALVFTVIGGFTLVLIYLVYDKVILRDRDVDGDIANGAMDAAINISSVLLAMSITLAFSIVGPFISWYEDIKSYSIAAFGSIIAVTIGRFLARALVVPLSPSTVRRNGKRVAGNVAKSTTVGAATIGVGLLVGLMVF